MRLSILLAFLQIFFVNASQHPEDKLLKDQKCNLINKTRQPEIYIYPSKKPKSSYDTHEADGFIVIEQEEPGYIFPNQPDKVSNS